jgi:toxin ParE1/3/4
MAAKVHFGLQGRHDLKQIGQYIAKDNPLRADTFLAEIHAKCLAYAENSEMGRERADLSPKLRSFPHGNYVVFYRRFRRSIQIIRVIHAHRDIKPAMFDQP